MGQGVALGGDDVDAGDSPALSTISEATGDWPLPLIT
jgi:hypothetical protein